MGGRMTEARGALQANFANEQALGQEKAKALYLIGEIYMNEARPDLAIPYFQRLYVMHGRWRDWVAKADDRSGEAFEKLNDQLSARRTYQELAEREDLSGFEEARKARGRLNLLGSSFARRGNSARTRMRSIAILRFLVLLCFAFADNAPGQIPQVGQDAIFLRQGDRLSWGNSRASMDKAFGCEDYCHLCPALRLMPRRFSLRLRSCARMWIALSFFR